MAEHAGAEPSGEGHSRPCADHPRRRIVTGLRAGDANVGPTHVGETAFAPTRTCWSARAWVEGDVRGGSARHHNRYVAPSSAEATTTNTQHSQESGIARTRLWERIRNAFRGAWTPPDRERSAGSERHGH